MSTTKHGQWKKHLLWIVPVMALIPATIWVLHQDSAPIAGQAQGHDRYQCPMHPQIVQDHPGFCPLCHMRLEKVEDDAPTGARSAPGHPKIVKYRNPMDPTIFSDHAMKDSMGMDYIPVYQDEFQDGTSVVTGKAGFTLSQERQQLIGVRTTLAQVEPIILTVTMPGRASSGGLVLAQLLEIDAGTLRPGMKARLSGPNGASVPATVVGVGRDVDSLTHSFTVTLRALAAAPWLRPGLYCEVTVPADLGHRLAVPQEAVLDTGER